MVVTTLSKPRRPTIHDVAHEARVSFKTVSRVLNQERGVAAPTAARVQAAITTLGFRRNDAARRLRIGGGAPTIALVIDDYDNPIFLATVAAVAESTSANGFLLLTASSRRDPTLEQTLIRSLLDSGVSGLLVLAAGDHSQPHGVRAGLPVVFLERGPAGSEADVVALDNVASAHGATTHLLRRWHRRVALLAPGPEEASSAERVEGYRTALVETGLWLDPQLLRLGVDDPDAAVVAVRELLAGDDPPTAFVATNSRLTAGAAGALAGPAALVGVDGPELPAAARQLVTTVGYDPAELGRQGATLLLNRLRDAGLPPQRHALTPRLTERGSGEVRPGVGAPSGRRRTWFRR